MQLAEQGDLSRSILRANLGALWKRDPRLFDLGCGDPDTSRVVATFSANGLPNLVLIDGENGLAYYDVKDPLKGVGDVLKEDDFTGARLVVVLGLGLGYELAHYVDEIAPKVRTQSIVVIEPDVDLFRHAMRQVDLAKWLGDPRIQLLVGQEGVALERSLERLISALELRPFAKSMRFAHVPGAMNFQREKLLDAMRRTGVVMRQQVRMAGVGPGEVLRELDNVVHNLGDIAASPDVGGLAHAGAGLPAILCSAGPSLVKELPLIKQLQDRAIIIAADGALAALVRAGIRPHLVTAVDSSELITHHVEGFDLPSTHLVAHVVLHPSAMKAWTGPKAMAHRDGDHFSQLGLELPTFDVSLSSGNMAFRLAQYMGCNPIVLVGQDLSYAADGASHAAGTRHAERGLLEALPSQAQLVPSNDGQMVRTQYGWFTYLSDMSRRVSETNARVINTSLGGARIEGTEVMPLSDVAALLPQRLDTGAILAGALPRRTDDAVEKNRALLVERMGLLRDEARMVAATAHEGAQAADKLLGDWLGDQFLGHENSLESIRSVPALAELRRLRQRVLLPTGPGAVPFAKLMRFAVLSYLLSTNADAYDAETESRSAPELARRIVDMDKGWFEVLGAVASRVADLMEVGIAEFERRSV